MVDPSRRRTGINRDYVERTYRDFASSGTQVAFSALWKETDLYIKAQTHLDKQAHSAILQGRKDIEDYIKKRPEFKTSLKPLPFDRDAPPIVREMLKAAAHVSVGPMAAVAGAIAESVGKALQVFSPEIIVENGGDIYLAIKEEITVGIFAGESLLNMKLGLRIPAGETPCGICTSSGTVGPSLSFGKADAVTVWAASTALADTTATALANRITTIEDIKPTLKQAANIPDIKGILVILGDQIGLWGAMDLVKLD